MSLMLYLAGAIGGLFLFFLAADYTDDQQAFVYLEYVSILITFFFLSYAAKDYIESRRETARRNYELKTKKTKDYKAKLGKISGRRR